MSSRIKGGLESFRILISKFPKSGLAPTAHFRIAGIYFALERYADAASEYLDIAEKYPGSGFASSACYNAGLAFKKLKNTEEALKQFKLVMSGYPKSEQARDSAIEAGSLYEAGKDYKNAIDTYAWLADNFSEKAPEARYWAASVYYNSGDYESAAKEYMKVPALEKASAIWKITAKARAAECFERLAKYEEAKKLYQEIIKESSNPDWKKSAEKRLKDLEDK